MNYIHPWDELEKGFSKTLFFLSLKNGFPIQENKGRVWWERWLLADAKAMIPASFGYWKDFKSPYLYIILPAIPLLTKRWLKLSVEWDIQEENLLESRPLKGCNQIPYRKKVIFVPDSLKRSLLESPQTALSYLFVLRMLLSTIEVRFRKKLSIIKKDFINGWERTWVVESMRGMSPMPEVPHHQSN